LAGHSAVVSGIRQRNAIVISLLMVMPLFYFHLENERINSDQGEEFPNGEAALREAEIIARDLSKNQSRPTTLKVIVTNRDGDEIGNVPLLNVIQ